MNELKELVFTILWILTLTGAFTGVIATWTRKRDPLPTRLAYVGVSLAFVIALYAEYQVSHGYFEAPGLAGSLVVIGLLCALLAPFVVAVMAPNDEAPWSEAAWRTLGLGMLVVGTCLGISLWAI